MAESIVEIESSRCPKGVKGLATAAAVVVVAAFEQEPDREATEADD